MEGETRLNGDSGDGSNGEKPPGKRIFGNFLMFLRSGTSHLHVEPVGYLNQFFA